MTPETPQCEPQKQIIMFKTKISAFLKLCNKDLKSVRRKKVLQETIWNVHGTQTWTEGKAPGCLSTGPKGKPSTIVLL